MKVIIGLGNPGDRYKNTRHNIGFCIIDTIILKSKVKSQKSKFVKKFNAEVYKDIINDEKFLLVKPQTFMNLSGQTVDSIISFYKMKPEDLIIIHDDVDLALGTVKISFNEGSAGHKGVESIIKSLGLKNFWRVRIGILSRTKDKINTEKFVLADFSKTELLMMDKIVDIVVLEIERTIKEDIESKKFTVDYDTD